MAQLNTPGISIDFLDAGIPSDIKAYLARKLTPQRIVEIALAGGEVIADAWRLIELPHNVSGEYQSTIMVHISEDDAAPGKAAVIVGTTSKHARWLEFGTVHEAAQPIMRQAYDYAVFPAKAKMAQKLGEVVR